MAAWVDSNCWVDGSEFDLLWASRWRKEARGEPNWPWLLTGERAWPSWGEDWGDVVGDPPGERGERDSSADRKARAPPL